MPYKLKKIGSGYKVCKKDGPKCFSKKPMPLARAKRQLAALHIHTEEFLSRFDTVILEALKDIKPIERFIYIGAVNDDGYDLQAKRAGYFKDSEKFGETPSHENMNVDGNLRWRYPVGSNTVFWWEPATPEAKESVEDYLAKRGFKNLKHYIATSDKDEEKVFDIAHGHEELSKKYKL